MEARQHQHPDSDIPEGLGDKGMTKRVDPISRHSFIKERQTQAMSELSYHQPNQPSQQDHTPSYPSKIMLPVILNRLKAKAEELLTEEQLGFGRGTKEQIFNSRLSHHRTSA